MLLLLRLPAERGDEFRHLLDDLFIHPLVYGLFHPKKRCLLVGNLLLLPCQINAEMHSVAQKAEELQIEFLNLFLQFMRRCHRRGMWRAAAKIAIAFDAECIWVYLGMLSATDTRPNSITLHRIFH